MQNTMSPESRYRIVEEIGEGTFGHVYRAIRIEDGALVVLKKILIRRPDHGLPKAVLREINAYQRVQHGHVLQLHEYYATPSSVVLVLEPMQGDLHQFLHRLSRPLTEPEIKVYLQPAAQGGPIH
jgi:CTD kinase subunit alpha